MDEGLVAPQRELFSIQSSIAIAVAILPLTMISGGTGVSIILLILSTALLISSAETFVDSVKKTARKLGVSELIIGLTIVSIGTSLPEILVGVNSSLEVAALGGCTSEICPSDFALGNIYGSVLVQISLVLGIVVLIHPLEVRPDWLARDGLLMFLAVILLTALILIDGRLDRLEGAILCLIYLFYIFNLLHQSDRIREDELLLGGSELVELGEINPKKIILGVILGLSLAVWSASILVNSATNIATNMSIPSAFIGATITAIGTSLPELAVALTAARRSKGVAIGTLIGSNITDPLLSIGLTALVYPVTVGSSAIFFTLIIPATVLTTGLSLLFMYTDFEFKRWEGGVLVFCYAIFVGLLVVATGLL